VVVNDVRAVPAVNGQNVEDCCEGALGSISAMRLSAFVQPFWPDVSRQNPERKRVALVGPLPPGGWVGIWMEVVVGRLNYLHASRHPPPPQAPLTVAGVDSRGEVLGNPWSTASGAMAASGSSSEGGIPGSKYGQQRRS